MRLRRGAVVLAAVVAVSACTTSEPIAVPDDIQQMVGTLVGTGVPMTGETCANLPVDAPTEGNHRYRGTVSLSLEDPDDMVAAMRTKAVSIGWQPQRVPELALALTGPEPGMQLAATRTESGLDIEVLVEYRCSSPSSLFRGNQPELTGPQEVRLVALRSAVTDLARAVYDAFGDVPASWPKPPGEPAACQADGRAGVLWVPPAVPDLDVAGPDQALATITEAVPEPWEVQAAGAEQAESGVIKTRITASATIEGIAVEIPMEMTTFTGGATKLFVRGAGVCVPAG